MNDELYLGEMWINEVRNRFHKRNKNWLCLICGQTGSGKSYSAISIAHKICGTTNTTFLALTAEQFMEYLNEPGLLEKGDIIIFDEAGVGLAARDWYSIQNKVLGSCLQTFRNLNVGVIFTTPDISFIDVQARKLFHNYLVTQRIDKRKELAFLRIYNIEVNALNGKTYYKHPRFNTKTGTFSMSHIAVPKPTRNLDSYESRKKAFTEILNRKALEAIKMVNEKARA